MTEVRTEPEAPSGPAEHVRSAIKPRAALLLFGVLFIQLAFIFSYIGAFHDPKPHQIPMGVVAPDGAADGTAEQVADQFNGISGDPVDARVVDDADEARAQIRDRTLAGALLLESSDSARLLTASAEGTSLADALQEVVTAAAQEQQLSVDVRDLVPAGSGDADGVSSFFLALGWVIGGYLAASVLTISLGALPPNVPRVMVRLASVALYAVVSGIVGAVIVDQVFGALTTNFWGIAGFGALLVFAICTFTMALQALTGIVGVGIAMFIFVVIGSPSAGGAYPSPLLPPFWREVGPFMAPGAGTSGVRSIVYFDGAEVLMPILVASVYFVVGAVVLVAVAARKSRQASAIAEVDVPVHAQRV